MNSSLRLVAVLLSAAALAACDTERAPEPLDVATQGIPPTIKVSTAEQRHVVFVAAGSGKLSEPEKAALVSFVSDAAIGGPEAVHVRLRGVLPPAQLASVSRVLVDAGIQPSKIEIEAVPASDLDLGPTHPPGQAVEVIASVSRVDYPVCPRQSWTTIAGNDNPSSSNFGCAEITNDEAMVADPRDLVQGESGGATDSELTTAAITRLHNDHIKTLSQSPTSTVVSQSNSGGS